MSSAAVTLTASAVTGNQAAGMGGGVGVYGADLTVTSSILDGNVSAGYGGGAYVSSGNVRIDTTTISANEAVLGGGVATSAAPLVDISRSTVSGNRAQGIGGIWAPSESFGGGLLRLTDSTVSGNTTTGPGYPSIILGSTVEIVASTIVGNVTPVGGYALYASDLSLSGSVVSDAVQACVQPSTSARFSLVSDTSCGTPATPSLLLGALADNGGPTLTHLPSVGSPAIDAIPVGTVGLCDGTQATDQRGSARPQGTACDIGSVER